MLATLLLATAMIAPGSPGRAGEPVPGAPAAVVLLDGRAGGTISAGELRCGSSVVQAGTPAATVATAPRPGLEQPTGARASWGWQPVAALGATVLRRPPPPASSWTAPRAGPVRSRVRASEGPWRPG